MDACRLCRAELPSQPAFLLSPAPEGAQVFPLPGSAVAGEGAPLDLRACVECGHFQLVGRPVAYHREVITAAGLSPAMRSFRTSQFETLVSRFGLAGRKVLEIGCGRGHMLGLLAGVGLVPTGLEAGEQGLAEARTCGFPVVEGYPDAGVCVPGGPFDAFVCLNFLEHAPDPRGFLAAVRAQLAPGAVGLVEVPSFERDLAGRRYYDLVRDHLSYFTRDSLRRLLELSGFDVLETGTAWHDDDVYAHVRVRPPPALPGWAEAREGTLEGLRDFFRRASARPGGVVVWGASHQALTLLGLTGAPGVRYVVDSAKFKQGRLTPVTGLPIVPATRLAEDPPGAVLVAAAGYSEEVVNILRRDHAFTGLVAILRDGAVSVVQEGT